MTYRKIQEKKLAQRQMDSKDAPQSERDSISITQKQFMESPWYRTLEAKPSASDYGGNMLLGVCGVRL